jgi:Flp pilus assembly protein TadB
MSSVDIFYLALVVFAISGFALALAYFSHQDLNFRRARERAEEEASRQAAKQAKPKAPVVARIPEHA